MGKEWLHWVGGGGGGGRSSRRRGRNNKSEEMKAAAAATSAGCMCAVFQIFDNFHHFHFPLNQQNASDLHPHNPFFQEEAGIIPKGAEAPRNSLELDETAIMDAASRSIAMKEEENLNFPVRINHIKTKTISSPKISTTKSRTILDDLSSECSSSNLNSPGLTKTPNLVARLMGLNLLPESTSPSISSARLKSQKKYSNFFDDDMKIGTRSLPETPRISSARRSDVEYHTHRLSLQINKENITNDEFKQGPGQYAKQIVKQVRESVSRRVGLSDITNTSRNREIRRDENLVLQKPMKKNSRNFSRFDEINPENKNKEISNLGIKSHRISVSSDYPLQQGKGSEKDEIIKGKCSSSGIRKKKEEAFVHSKATNKGSLMEKKSKRNSPLSSEILNISGPTLLQVRKDPSPPPTKLPQKQVSDALSSKRSTQLSSSTSHSYKQLQLHPHKIFTIPDNTNSCATTTCGGGAAAAYGNYIQRILNRAGIINKATTLTKWHTLSHPIDPLIFHYLELFPPSAAVSAAAYGRGSSNTALRHKSDRKLIFQLVDELLAEILKPHFDFKTWVSPNRSEDDDFPLVDELCEKIDSFPAANCQVLEDIDSLIEKDLRKSQLNGFFEEDGESIVCEIEGEIMEWLVGETVSFLG